jgi:hypothetical protein
MVKLMVLVLGTKVTVTFDSVAGTPPMVSLGNTGIVAGNMPGMVAVLFVASITNTGVLTVLLDGTVSLSAPVIALMVTLPLCGAVKLTSQTMLWPGNNVATGDGGVHTTCEPDGKPLTPQLALSATLVVAVHTTVPVTCAPGDELAGKPDWLTDISELPTEITAVAVSHTAGAACAQIW